MALATATVTIFLAGCGGSDSAPPPPPAPAPEPATLSKADLISQGDGLCAEVNAAIGTIQNSTTIAESDKVSQVSELYSGLADRLEKLGTPDDGEAPADVVAALRELGDPAGTGDPAAFQDAARTYGFIECAGGPSAPAVPDTSGSTTPSTSPDTGQTYETPESAPAPAPAPETGGVTPDAPSGGTAPPSSGSGSPGSGGSGTGGIGPG